MISKRKKKPTTTQVQTTKKFWPRKSSNQQKPFNAEWPCPVVKQRKKLPNSISARTRATLRAMTPSTSIKCLINIHATSVTDLSSLSILRSSFVCEHKFGVFFVCVHDFNCNSLFTLNSQSKRVFVS